MRISNPSLLAGYNIDQSLEDLYRLITKGQLTAVIKKLHEEIEHTFTGDHNTLGTYGYAYLERNGKISESLIPGAMADNILSTNVSTIMSSNLSKQLTYEVYPSGFTNAQKYISNYLLLSSTPSIGIGDLLFIGPKSENDY